MRGGGRQWQLTDQILQIGLFLVVVFVVIFSSHRRGDSKSSSGV